MNIGIFGTGGVARSIAAKFVSLGHTVMLGTRNVEETKNRTEGDNMGNISFKEWYSQNNSVKLGTFADVGAFGELLVNATTGIGSLSAISAAGEKKSQRESIDRYFQSAGFLQRLPSILKCIQY